MPRLQIPRPNPKQMEFFNARAKYICFGGARAGGKSWGVRIKAILLAFQYPGILIYIIRKSYPELRATGCTGELQRLEEGDRLSERERDFLPIPGDRARHAALPGN